MDHTIFAQSSKFGKAGVSVFRISGPNSMKVLRLLTKAQDFDFKPRYSYLRKIYIPYTDDIIDHAMVTFFAKPASFTGEDVVEIHTHGSIAISRLLSESVLKIDGIRLAEQGEFTKRAFLNNKFDLTSAEGISDLIDAQTYVQHKQAISQMNGNMWKLYDKWRLKLLKIMCLLEAYIDFPDEDIDPIILKDANNIMKEVQTEISIHLNDNHRGERIRSGLTLAILGRPNVGKSSLMNFLMQRDISIVSNIAGTTRDIVEGSLDICGYSILIKDTAGIRDEIDNTIEQEGIKRAKFAASESDIKIIIASYPEVKWIDCEYDKNTIYVVNKIDLAEHPDAFLDSLNENYYGISIRNEFGLQELIHAIAKIAENLSGTGDDVYITRTRHRAALNKALEYLSNVDFSKDLVLITEDIRMSARAIGSITGYITVDEILGEIFSNFCIGK
jgi:tRNA modification GTPase